jgi:hypothetical protein
LDEGVELTKKADETWDFQTNKIRLLEANQGNFSEKVKTERKRFIGHIGLARIGVGKHVGYKVSLGLKGKRKDDLAGWSAQARVFYQNALDNKELEPILKKVGLDRKTLQEGLDMVTELENDENALLVLRGEVSQSILDRDDAFENLALWLKAFTQVCLMVFKYEPERQNLERLGIPALTSKKRRKNKESEEPETEENAGS